MLKRDVCSCDQREREKFLSKGSICKWRRGDLVRSCGISSFVYFRASDDEGALGNYIVQFCIEKFEIMRYYPKRGAQCVGLPT